MDKFYRELADILEVDEVARDRNLRDFETWDSLAALSIVVAVQSNFGITITAADLARVQTPAALEDLISSRRAGKTE